MLPSVSVQKNPFALPSLPPSADGIAAIIAGAAAGVSSTPQIWTSPNLLQQNNVAGPLVEYGSYVQNTAQKPIVGLRSVPSVAATYGSITTTGLGTGGIKQGTFTVAATAATFPFEHYQVVINFPIGGTLGTPGITWTYSLDGGNNVSAPQALGSGLVLAIPNSGVSFTLATTGTSTVVAGDGLTCFTERALMSDSDVATEVGILALSRQPWEGCLLDNSFGSASVAVVDGLLSGLEAKGQYKFFLMNTRFKNEPEPTAETETSYATAMIALMGQQTSERGCVGADGGHLPSSLTGLNLKRPTALALMAMAMSVTPNISIDPSYVGNGPAAGFSIADGNSMPIDHDEDLYQTLDVAGFSTLRSFATAGPQGVYITNANIISPSNSNIRYLQQLRVLNKACTIVWALLTGQLSRGVDVAYNPQTKQLNIAEGDAQALEELVNPQLESALAGQVSVVNGAPGVAMTISRTDNLGITPAIVTATVAVVGKAYVKGFLVTVAFSKTIAVAPSAS